MRIDARPRNPRHEHRLVPSSERPQGPSSHEWCVLDFSGARYSKLLVLTCRVPAIPAHEKDRLSRSLDWLNRSLTMRTVRHAEGKRFELLVRGYRTLVFKTSSFGRSDNLP